MDVKQPLAERIAIALAGKLITLRWLIVALTLLGVAGLGSGLARVVFDPQYTAYFSEQNPELRAFERTRATYTKSDNFIYILKPEGGEVFTPEVLEAVKWLTEQGWQIPYALRVDSITNFQHTYAEEDDLIVEDLVLDPAGLTPEGLAQKRAIAIAEPLLRDLLITPDASVTAVNVTIQYPEESLEEVPVSVEAARAIRDEFKKRYPDLEVGISGLAMLNNGFNEVAQYDLKTLIPLMYGVLIVLMLSALRSVSALVTTLLIVIFSSVSAVGVAAFLGFRLDPLSATAPTIILTLAIANSIHILVALRFAMRDGMTKRDGIVEAMRLNFLPVSITSITTIIGFLALNFSDSPPFRVLGNITAMGIAAAWVYSIFFLPALMAILPFRPKALEGGQKRREPFVAFADVVIAHSRVVLLVTLVISGILISFIPRNEFNDVFPHYFDTRLEFRRDTDFLTQYFGMMPVDFSIRAKTPGGISEPEVLEVVERFAEWARQQPKITHVFALSDIMKRLNKNLHGDDESYYRIPDDRELSAQYLLLYELSLPYGLDLNDRINIDKSATRVTATMDIVSTRETKDFLNASRKWFEENAPELEIPDATGVHVMFTFITDRNVQSMMRGTTIAVIAIGFVMILALRSIAMGGLSIVANGVPILVTFGIWAITVGQVGFAVAVVTSISLGLIVDNAVHILSKYVGAIRDKAMSVEDAVRYAFRNVGFAVFVNTAVLTAGFSVFMLSAFDVNVQLGKLTALSIVVAFIIDFLLLPAILVAMPRFQRKS